MPDPRWAGASSSDTTVTIQTKSLQLSYQVGAKEFSPSTLKITSLDSSSAFTSWVPGQANPGNLLGTIKSLDDIGPISLNCSQIKNVRIHDESLHCTWGLVSRDGWAVYNDTASPVMDPTTGWWDVGNNTNLVDWYFFGHGHDYRGALSDYTQV